MRARLLALAAWVCVACATPAVETPRLSGARTLDGAPLVELLSAPRLVLVFVDPECPIANAYAPELRRLQGEYEPRGVTFALVYSDPARKEPEVRAHAAAYDHGAQLVLDPEQSLAGHTGATMTPEACVLVGGELVYRGRIDDRFFALGKQRAAPTTRDLLAALDAVLAGGTPSGEWPPAIGCYIPPKR
jgi:hypothetical protein